MDRIEITYKSIDEMIESDGKPRPNEFGGGVWKATEEFEIYKKQVGCRYTEKQWEKFENYFLNRFGGKTK